MEWAAALRAAEAESAERHLGSREAMARRAPWTPGGDTGSTMRSRPIPLALASADGVELVIRTGDDFPVGAPMREQGRLA